jgi:DNA-binding PadR family transcriptional regulator
MAKSSELETSALGFIWRDGPVSAYAVRRFYLDSPTLQWSGSAGAIYPLLARMKRRGLVRAVSRPTGRRPAQVYSITAKGVAALQRWLKPPFPPRDVAATIDGLRTRTYFLLALSAADRRKFFAAAERAIAQEVRRGVALLSTDYARADPLAPLAIRGSIMIARARLQWIKELARGVARLKETSPSRRASSRRSVK